MNTAQIAAKQESRRRVAKALYETMPVGVEFRDMSSERFGLSACPEIGPQAIKDRITDIVNAGILQRRMEMGHHGNNLPLGRHYHWTLLVDENEAMRRLDDLDATESITFHRNIVEGAKRGAEKRAKSSVALTTTTDKPAYTIRDGIAVEAIIGPEPEPPMSASLKAMRFQTANETVALVEAARQYRDRHASIDTKFIELIENAEKFGVTIDVEAMQNAISYDHDERLENIGLVLPYVDDLANRVAQLTSQVEHQQQKTREYDRLHVENQKLRAQVERLIASKVAS